MTTRRATTVLLIAAACASAQSGLDRPQLGMMLDSSGAVRAVLGLPGSITLADPAASGVLSLGCSAFCLFKTDSSMISPDSSAAAPPGPAQFAFDSAGAFVYFAAARQLARWQSGALTFLDYDIAGEILSLRSREGSPEFAVRRGDGIEILRDGNIVVDSLPRNARTVLLLENGVLYSTGEGLVLRRADGSQLRFPLAGPKTFLAMAPGYIEIRAAAATYALRLAPGREQLFLLPEPLQ